MQLQPVYGGRPVIVVDLPPTGPVHPVVAQRRRFVDLLAGLAEDEWRQPSRCEGWTVQDVVTHLITTNQFWAFSIQAGLDGSSTELLATFDPVTSPAEMVAGVGAMPVGDTLAQFTESAEAFVGLVEGLAASDLDVLAEAPPGHVSVARVCDHAVWDSWVHERDVVLPLGRPPVVEADEVLASLRYGATLGFAFGVSQGLPAEGRVLVEATDPDDRFVIEGSATGVRVSAAGEGSDERVLRGDAVDLVELLAFRDVGRPPPPEVDWLTAGLGVVFDRG